MSLSLTVDPADPTPTYEQVRRQLADLVRAGRLRPGDRVPPLRQLAGDLGLAVGTVARAYRELEQDGILQSRRGGGTRVSTGAGTTGPPAELLDELARGLVIRATQLGFPAMEVRAAVEAALTGID